MIRIIATWMSLVTAAAPPPAPVAPGSPCHGAPDDLRCEARRKELARAEAQREAVRREVPTGATPLEIAVHLHAGATRHADAVLALEAAEAASLAGAAGATRLAARSLALARAWIAADAVVGERRVDLAALPMLRARCELIDRVLRARPANAQVEMARRGVQAQRAGAVMAALGGGGVALVAGGFAVASDRHEKLAAVRDEAWRHDFTSLDTQGRRAGRMIAAGSLIAAIGLTLGVALLAVGAGDLRRARPASRRARLQLAPGGAATLTVRF